MTEPVSANGLYPAQVLQDLAKSGISPSDVRVRPLGPSEKQATGTPTNVNGYVLPYFSLSGSAIPFYRVKLFQTSPDAPKYKQLSGSSNHVYFPPNLFQILPAAKFLLLVEGEKKAAALCKFGYPAVALSGVWSWKNRTLTIPKDAKLTQEKDGSITARMGPEKGAVESAGAYAEGFQELTDMIAVRNIPLVICYDYDSKEKTRIEVQKAAAILGYELRYRGIPLSNIRQLILAPNAATVGLSKIAPDDFLVHPELGTAEFSKQLTQCLAARSAFPKHPNTKEYVNKRLQKTHINRSELQGLSTAVLCDLDTRGARLRCSDDDSLYYFDYTKRKLLRVGFDLNTEYSKSPFGIKLYQDYNLSGQDFRLLGWLGSQYSAEEPITNVTPERVLTLRKDHLYYQINDGQVLKVGAEGTRIINNGDDDILFEAESVKNIDEAQFKEAYQFVKSQTWDCWWLHVLRDARIRDTDDDKARKLLALLYSMSPWMYRWRGTQLPIEMMCGEAGSGKSTLFELRLSILTGDPILRNAPTDMRDWTASVAATGGLHVTDNVHMTDGKLRQELSDELCRIITEPNPHIERRKLYSDTTLVRTPVKTVFAITAIKQPFTNVDIIQRAIITELDKGTEDLRYDADWKKHQLDRFGGRPYWIAHQMVFMEKLFALIQDKWKDRYQAAYRLINVEQLLMLAAEVYGWESEWIPGFLESTRDRRMSESDWALEGIQAFCTAMCDQYGAGVTQKAFVASDLVNWCEMDDDYKKCGVLQDTRLLGRYLATHKQMLATIAGFEPRGKYGNKAAYQIRPLPSKAT